MVHSGGFAGGLRRRDSTWPPRPMKAPAMILYFVKRHLLLAILCSLGAVDARAQLVDKVVRERIAGIDVIACRTGVKDVITFSGSLPAGDVFAPKNNLAVPTLTGGMLDKGTTQEDKFAIAQKLDNIGAKIEFAV